MFKVGDVVVLKSNSDPMTVVDVVPDEDAGGGAWVNVNWHDKGGKHQNQTYPAAALEAYEGPPMPGGGYVP